jgi:hypothetical protein
MNADSIGASALREAAAGKSGMSWLGQAISIDLVNTLVPAPDAAVDLLASFGGFREWFLWEEERLEQTAEIDLRCLSRSRVMALRDAVRSTFDSVLDEASDLRGERGTSHRFGLPAFECLWTVASGSESDDDLMFSHAILVSTQRVLEANPLSLRRCRLPSCGLFWEESLPCTRCPGCATEA